MIHESSYPMMARSAIESATGIGHKQSSQRSDLRIIGLGRFRRAESPVFAGRSAFVFDVNWTNPNVQFNERE